MKELILKFQTKNKPWYYSQDPETPFDRATSLQHRYHLEWVPSSKASSYMNADDAMTEAIHSRKSVVWAKSDIHTTCS